MRRTLTHASHYLLDRFYQKALAILLIERFERHTHLVETQILPCHIFLEYSINALKPQKMFLAARVKRSPTPCLASVF